MSCTSNIEAPALPTDIGPPHPAPDHAWTDLTYLLHRSGLSWAYYLKKGKEPDCETGDMFCRFKDQDPRTPGIWNPLPSFDTVRQDGQLGNVKPTSDLFAAARANQLPAVSWVIPSGVVSEHPTSSIHAGQAYVTSVINAIMRSRDWSSTAIFLTWDDWGGFYDHVVPPVIDGNGYGFRVPGIVISPMRDVATSTTSSSASTRSRSSSRMTSCTASAWTRGLTIDPTRARPCGRTPVGWGTWSATSTSISAHGRRSCSR